MSFLSKRIIINIIGWYGTETMGDRAILDGIFAVFDNVYDGKMEFRIGSLFPFYTDRTLCEEEKKYSKTAPNAVFKVYNVKNKLERIRQVKESSMVIMGGGPLMDIDELSIIRDCFRAAKIYKKKTCVFGCGIGPLANKRNIKILKQILNYSDLVFFRDLISVEIAKKLYNRTYECLGDPAIISIEKYRNENIKKTEKYAVLNLRDYPQNAYGGKCYFGKKEVNELIDLMVNDGYMVKLVPMHTFYVGGDDRVYLEEMVFDNKKNHMVEVLHKPLCLEEMYKLYMNASMCFGMRYHSVVMQTILNGNNAILDYTDKKTGKIYGFIDITNSLDFYKNRRIDIHEMINTEQIISIYNELKVGKEHNYLYSRTLEKYSEEINKIV